MVTTGVFDCSVLISADVKLSQYGSNLSQSLKISENRIVKRLRETIVQLINGDVTNDDVNETRLQVNIIFSAFLMSSSSSFISHALVITQLLSSYSKLDKKN
jgi:hypothetical protein